MSEDVPQAVSHQAYPATFSVDYQETVSYTHLTLPTNREV